MVYNVVWGTAWLTLLRDKWTSSAATLGQSMPWTGGVWLLWVGFTLPTGIAIMAHAASQPLRTIKASLAASLLVGILFSGGTSLAFVRESKPSDLILLDCVVNLSGMLLAAMVAGWSMRRHDAQHHA